MKPLVTAVPVEVADELMDATELTPRDRRLIESGLAINEDLETMRKGYMARGLIQATLPHREIKDRLVYRRVNGDVSLTITGNEDVGGLPFGTVPRLLVVWMTSEALRTGQRRLLMGDSMAKFMLKIGMKPTGGEKGDIARFKLQAARLFGCSMAFVRRNEKGMRITPRTVVDDALLWWQDSGNKAEPSFVELSTPFFSEVTERPVPVNLDAVAQLKRSSMALDMYCWLTYKAFYTKRATRPISWESLAVQFGSQYKVLRQFRAAFLADLKRVAAVYPHVNVEVTDAGLVVRPTLPHIPPRAVAGSA